MSGSPARSPAGSPARSPAGGRADAWETAGAETCSRLRRRLFFAVIATIPIAGWTSSPVNPLAVS